MKLRLSTLLSLCAAAIAGFILFQTSQNVQDAEGRLRNVQTALSKEQDAMRVLETEWDYLNRPDRLEELARQLLKMKPQSPTSLVRDSSDLPETGAPALPKRKPEFQIRPAVVTAPPALEKPVERDVAAKVESLQTDLPMPSPVNNNASTNDIRQQFNTLLNDLVSQEPSSGGGAR
jgi:hypothetical protein